MPKMLTIRLGSLVLSALIGIAGSLLLSTSSQRLLAQQASPSPHTLSPELKKFEDHGAKFTTKTLMNQDSIVKQFAKRANGFFCSGNRCVCSGLADCEDLVFGTNLCGGTIVCTNSPTPVCVCNRKP
jgi:hypothetical protein